MGRDAGRNFGLSPCLNYRTNSMQDVFLIRQSGLEPAISRTSTMTRIRPSLPQDQIEPSAQWPSHERRCVRTDSAGEAVELALTWSVARGELVAIVMGDADGRVVCHSRTDIDLNSVAAVLPLVEQGQTVARVSHFGQGFPIVVRKFKIRDEVFYLGVLGGSAETREQEADRSMAAAIRILS